MPEPVLLPPLGPGADPLRAVLPALPLPPPGLRRVPGPGLRGDRRQGADRHAAGRGRFEHAQADVSGRREDEEDQAQEDLGQGYRAGWSKK